MGIIRIYRTRSNILLADGEIKEISAGDIGTGECHVVDAGGRTVIPGLIDNHIHATIPTPEYDRIYQDAGDVYRPSMPIVFLKCDPAAGIYHDTRYRRR